jgi:site-specific recombinase XerD
LLSRRAKGCKPSTLDDYLWKLKCFQSWVADQDWMAVETLEAFLVHQRDRGLSAHSVDAFYRVLRAFFRWFCRRRKVPNPIEELERPLLPKKRPRTVTAADVWQLLSSIQGDGWIDHRDRLLVLLFFSTGIRRGEVAALWVTDFNRHSHTLHIRDGKGGVDREIPLPVEIRPALLEYLLARPAWTGPEVFLSDNGAGGVRGVLSGDGIRQMLIRRCQAAGVPYYNPHSFRHGAAVALLNDGGADMSFIQALLGHADIRTTQGLYARWRLDGLSQAHAVAWDAIRRNQ